MMNGNAKKFETKCLAIRPNAEEIRYTFFCKSSLGGENTKSYKNSCFDMMTTQNNK